MPVQKDLCEYIYKSRPVADATPQILDERFDIGDLFILHVGLLLIEAIV